MKSRIQSKPREIVESRELGAKRSVDVHPAKAKSKRADSRIKQDHTNEKCRRNEPADSLPHLVRHRSVEVLPRTARVSRAAFCSAFSELTTPARAALSQRWRISETFAYSGIRGRILAVRTISRNSSGTRLCRAGMRPALEYSRSSCCGLVANRTNSHAASGFGENRETAKPHPPSVAACIAPGPCTMGTNLTF